MPAPGAAGVRPPVRLRDSVGARQSAGTAFARIAWIEPGRALRLRRPVLWMVDGGLICSGLLLNGCAGRRLVAPAQRGGMFFVVKCQWFYKVGCWFGVFSQSFVKVAWRCVVPPPQPARERMGCAGLFAGRRAAQRSPKYLPPNTRCQVFLRCTW